MKELIGEGGGGALTWETTVTINLLECVVSMHVQRASTSESKIFQRTLPSVTCSTAAPGLHVQMEPRCNMLLTLTWANLYVYDHF